MSPHAGFLSCFYTPMYPHLTPTRSVLAHYGGSSSKMTLHITLLTRLASVAGAVIQAIGRSEFEDGLRPGSPELILSDQRSVRTNL